MEKDSIYSLPKIKGKEQRIINREKKDGVDIEKGAKLFPSKVDANIEFFKRYWEYFTNYPDLFIDLIIPSYSHFELYFYQRIFLRACLRYRYHYCVACLTKGTLVETPKGLKKIEDFAKGDIIYSHGGTEPVARPTKNLWKGGYVEIDGDSVERKFTCTSSHEFLVRSDNKKVSWKQAKDLREDDRILTKIENKSDIRHYYYKDRKYSTDSDFCELMGIFASRGSIRNGRVEFLFYPGESAIKNRVSSLMISKFSILKKQTENRNGQLFMTYSDRDLLELMSDLTGVNSGRVDNRIPECVLGAKNEDQINFVKGWLEGEKNFSCNKGSCELKGISSSYNFIRDTKMILLRSGIMPIVKTRDIDDRIRTSLMVDHQIGEIFYNAIIKNIKVEIPRELKKEIIIFDGNLFIEGSRLDLTIIHGDEQTVYCLEVPKNSSFSVAGQMSHNCRAFSKTFISILGMYLVCMFRPGSKVFICAPKKEQSAKIAKEKIEEIWKLFPMLRREIIGEGSFLKDQVTLTFRNGSIFDVVGALDSTRGGRRHLGLVDEVRDHDGDVLNEVVLPLLNVSRRTASGAMNPTEPHQVQFYMTSASVKGSYAYNKLIECLENSIINPKDSFVWGCSYKLPLAHGLIDEQYINEIRTSPTYKEESFARE